jgi:hypothetical protein
MQFLLDKTRSAPKAVDYVPAKYRKSPQFAPNPETEEAAVKVAEQAKTVVTQTSVVVRKQLPN